MAGVEKHQSPDAAIRQMMFNVARKERFFKRISGKNRKFRLKRHFFSVLRRFLTKKTGCVSDESMR